MVPGFIVAPGGGASLLRVSARDEEEIAARRGIAWSGGEHAVLAYLYPLLLAIPVAVYLELTHGSPVGIFVASAVAIIPLAGLMGKATEEIALHAGPRVGGFLNATFGNAAELIITIFAIRAGLFEVVKASITGSIISNILLVLGLSALAGGLRYETLRFNGQVALMNASLLLLAVIALMIPAVFFLGGSMGGAESGALSLGVAVTLMSTYVLSLLFTFHTHRHLFHTAHDRIERAEWSQGKALGVLAGATALVALMSEFLVGSLEQVTKHVGLSELFIGVVVIPLVGNAAEHATAILMAMKNRMDLALEIAVGSSTQIAVFVAPLLIFISYLFGTPMSYVFNVFELTAIGLSVLIANLISADGEINWLEGTQLLAAYAIIGLGFYYVG